MARKNAPRPARGTRDLLPADARRRRYVLDVLEDVFRSFGFEPLVTPAIENASTLLGKYGPDAERLIYRAGLGGKDDLGLRYDLTVPLARVVASEGDLPTPFRRYQIAPVWRGERPQRGRYREFVQADVDIVGTESVLADAEIIEVVVRALERLGLGASRTKINNRKLLNGIGRYAGVAEPLLPGLYRAIDKLDKIGLEGVRRELLAVGLPGDLLNRQRQAVGRWLEGKADRERLDADLRLAIPEGAPAGVGTRALPAFLDALAAFPQRADDPRVPDAETRSSARAAAMGASIAALRAETPDAELIDENTTARLLELLQLRGEPRALLAELESRLDDAEASRGITELRTVVDALDAAGVGAERYEVDFAMVRGLEYYTGTIFETVVEDPPIGSITGGGRYDELIGLFGRPSPACGTSLGVDRLVDVMEAAGLFPAELDAPTPQVLVSQFDEESRMDAVALASELRRAGLRCELVYEPGGLGGQIRFALQRGIPVMVIAGPDEIAAGEVTVKDLAAERQERVPRAALAEAVRAALEGDESAA